MGNGINQSRTAFPIFSNKSLSDFRITVIVSTIYVPKEKISKWITVNEIDQYDFCPADEEILTRLKTIE